MNVAFAGGASQVGSADLLAIVDFARLLWYLQFMNRSVRNSNRKHMTRFGWAVEGVAR